MELCLINNKVCIYSRKDWENLRRNYRIIGAHLGASQATPSLPIALLPEEALLLLKRNIIKVAVYPNLQKPPTQADCHKYNSTKVQLLEAEQCIYKKQRTKDLKQIIDKIVEAKKKKGVHVSNETVLEEELSKQTVTVDTMIWPMLTEAPDSFKEPRTLSPLAEILQETTLTKAAVFEDLWSRGYYITCGRKFGGDFLVYRGDPTAFHAVYIIRCVQDVTKDVHLSQLIAFGRLGTSVKKKAVLASLCSNTINYVTINWFDA
ncbi:hypothetical protein PPYR_14324 [Photinus pyralis]|uniref:tRNA-intron lyase n=2 Tax=Photinus pyralis TaxID=7054 RepID=A0A1Y1LF38_PHOPY|nr:tRNA-splicing endonuclease subunit Sen34 [Photinus pyralis]KAB0792365.1 hypothetical protein PPYR_14324 [Photinus pyralis]